MHGAFHAVLSVASFIGIRADHDYDGGIIITASHLPYNRNGFKFFTKDGGFDKNDITLLLEQAAQLHNQAQAPHANGDARYIDSAWVLDRALQVDGSRIQRVSPRC